MADRRWHPIYEALRDQIESGDLRPGDQLPTEPALCERFGVSRTTVTRALNRLQQAGLVGPGRGRAGRTVREWVRIEMDMSRFELGAYIDDPEGGVDQWKAGVLAAGWTPRQVIDGAIGLPVPARIARYLDVDPGDLLVRRRRLRYVSKPEDGIPEVLAMVADTWTPSDIAQRKVDGVAPLLSPEDVTLPGGIYHALGFRQVRFLDSIEARVPTDDEVELMALPPGTPVGQHSRVGIDDTGRRVRVLIQTWAGDRQIITYEHQVPDRRLPDSIRKG